VISPEKVGNQIYFQFGGNVLETIGNLMKIQGAGSKMALLTLMYSFSKFEVNYKMNVILVIVIEN